MQLLPVGRGQAAVVVTKAFLEVPLYGYRDLSACLPSTEALYSGLTTFSATRATTLQTPSQVALGPAPHLSTSLTSQLPC